MKDLTIKPKPGVLVKDPVTGQPLSEAGEKKPATTYWLRRLKDGDVTDLDAMAVEGDAL